MFRPEGLALSSSALGSFAKFRLGRNPGWLADYPCPA